MTPKSFFGLFGGKSDDDKEPESPDPTQEKRREARLDLGEPALAVTLDVPGQSLPVVAAVVNVSARGLRLKMDAAVRAGLTVGNELTALLKLETFEVRMTLRLVRTIGENEGGFRIRPPFPKELERLEKYLEPRFLGRSLREIDPKVLQRDVGPYKRMRWFQGHNETSLFSWEDEAGAVVHQQLLFLEQVVEWQSSEPVRTGRIRGEGPGLSGWVKADLLEFDPAPSPDLIGKATILVESSSIDEKIKGIFLAKAGAGRKPQ